MTPEELEAAKWAAHEKECESAAVAYLKEQKLRGQRSAMAGFVIGFAAGATASLLIGIMLHALRCY